MATDRYQGLRDALAAGPTEGPWAYEPHGDTGDYGVGVLWDEHDQPQSGRCEPGKFLVVDPVVPELCGQTNAAYIAAADPDTIAALIRERDNLRGLLAEAITEIDDWAAYAAPVFREKHDLEGTLARFRAALADGEASK